MPAPTSPPTTLLSPSQIDDLLTFARYGETLELNELLTSLSETLHIPPLAILEQARDPVTGNGVGHMAAGNGHDELLQSLPHNHQHPTVLTSPNLAGSTPLHYAALNGHLSTVRLLVEKYGVDVRAINKAGLTAEEEAGRSGRGEVEGWLEGWRDGRGEGKGEGKEEDGKEGDGLEGKEARLEEEEGVGEIRVGE